MKRDEQVRFDRLVSDLVKLDRKRDRKMRQIKAQQEKIDKLKNKKES
jgi:hypothetical protein|tara:strand:- start:1539 stop:1679 length:141 start_codon:yes stop_codon:yes gene_type:complete